MRGGKRGFTLVEIMKVQEYVKGNKLPTCPASGVYTWNPIATDPACDKSADGHKLAP